MNKFILISIFCAVGALSSAQSYLYRLEIILQDGDLIFQDLDCELCEAIEGVTDGYDNYNFSHVGIVKRTADSVFVGEAISAGVVWTPLEEFVRRAEKEGIPQLLVMRLKPRFQKHIPPALQFIESKKGASYDPLYVYGDERYYCSELLHDAFAQSDSTLFSLQSMTFKTPDGSRFHPAWIDYFRERDVDIPESQPGINPGGMSTSPHLTPIFVLGLE